MGKLIVELPDKLHTQLKQQAASSRTTLKAIVITLLDRYLHQVPQHQMARTTRLCGAWKDVRSAETLIAELRSARRWWTRSR